MRRRFAAMLSVQGQKCSISTHDAAGFLTTIAILKHHNNTSTFQYHHARTVPLVCKNVIYVIKCRMIFKWRKAFSNRTLVPPGLNVNFTFIWASQSYRAHVTLRLCFELYLNVTMRVYFLVAFKRIFAFHGFFEMFVTLQCDLEARQPFSFLKYFVDQSCAVNVFLQLILI